MFQSYHAMKYPMTTRAGQPTSALYGYCRLLLHALEHLQPTHAACVLEGGTGKSSHRVKILGSYKSNRNPPADDLRSQFNLMEPIADALGIASIYKEGYEADDVIATLTNTAVNTDGIDSVVIISSDKDLLQLVGCGKEKEDEKGEGDRNTLMSSSSTTVRICKPNLKALKSFSTSSIGPYEVVQSFGINPEQMVDFLSLTGDSADNIPGIPSIGAARAKKLLNSYGTLQEVIAAANDLNAKFVYGDKIRKAVIEHSAVAERNTQLVRLFHDLDLTQEIARSVEKSAADSGVTFPPMLSITESLRFGRGRSGETSEKLMRAVIEEFEFDSLLPNAERVHEIYRRD
mmetsp:Transcript_10573/g.16921  ORF Transcript_10573/g.16921 Transcript_10573/m.16921 type:complete len:345 (-) Transcript_10573:89-1123(-)